jgi:hypothetical protein
MCTVTLSYDKKNAQAQQKLEALLATGLFTELQVDYHDEVDEFPGLDYNDPELWKDDGDMPSLPEGKETFTPEELYKIVMTDVRKIYAQ